MPHRKIASLVIAAVSLVIAPGASAAPSSEGCSQVVSIMTLNIKVGKISPAYRVGETIKIPVVVTRPGEEDPADQGIPLEPPASEVAQDVMLLGVVRVGGGIIYQSAVTDAEGKATLSLKLRNVPKGPADVEIEAKKVIVETACATVQEAATREIEDAFKVR